ncbi:bestrophin family protein [Paraburkholderia susongensis]|uniref:Putative membrane protein n=1 Tax=Paraburkholderia susongensis TaxID=1515439 RepID=A0A1X7M5S4_9BURK|nr:bestrophin family ion channel [Paraburkholderia susongensis]SMG61104.1 putative membrane protein [Paraburkholderia susongensis]
MIVPGRVRWAEILRYVGRPLIWLLMWDVVVTVVYLHTRGSLTFPGLPLSLLGSVIAIYLSFRNAAAYARWWEARTLWGAMVNHSRSFAREIRLLLPEGLPGLTEELVRRHIAYVHALRLHLRREPPWDELARRLAPGEVLRLKGVANVPNAIMNRTAEIIATQTGLDSIRLATVTRTMSELSNAQGGMERIKNTPFPNQYSAYPVFFTHAFCFLMPVGLVGSLGVYTPLGSTAAGFLLLALLKVGDDMQSPFSNTENDVPINALARAIEIDLLDCINEPHALKPVAVESGVLW